MLRLAIVTIALVAAGAQVAPRSPKYSDQPQFASILNEQRYLSGDGTFGAAYQQEDGIDFKEESDAEGNRKGSYSYIDPTGQRRTVTYTAGKNGFVASGDHLPVAPAPPPQPQQYNNAPSPQYNRPSPQYNSISSRQYDPDNDDGQYRPELYEGYVAPNQNHIVTSAPVRPAYSASYSAKPQPQYSPAPQPQYSPAPQPQYSPVPQPQYSPASQPQYSGFPQSRGPLQEPRPSYQLEPTTPAPHRFYPPGQFDLNRSPDGFTYSFRKA